MRLLWNIVHLFFFRHSLISFNFLRKILLSLFGAEIGADVLIYPSVRVWAPWNLSIGDRAVIGPNVNLYNVGFIKIDEDVTISQNSHICTASHKIDSPSRELLYAPVEIRKGAWVFSDAFISPGIIIDEGAVVGARSVVTKNVEAFNVVGGNPAKFLKKRNVDWLNS